jgi:transposase InsO family protein
MGGTERHQWTVDKPETGGTADAGTGVTGPPEAEARGHYRCGAWVERSGKPAESGLGEKWVSDITYMRTRTGWLYLTVIIELWDRKVIGWTFSEDLGAVHVCAALVMACGNCPPQAGLLFHSDRGVQYCSEESRKTLEGNCPGIRRSMSWKGNCWDNACAESFFKTLKGELTVLEGKHSKGEVKTAVFEYIEIYYNKKRGHSALGYAAPKP